MPLGGSWPRQCRCTAGSASPGTYDLHLYVKRGTARRELLRRCVLPSRPARDTARLRPRDRPQPNLTAEANWYCGAAVRPVRAVIVEQKGRMWPGSSPPNRSSKRSSTGWTPSSARRSSRSTCCGARTFHPLDDALRAIVDPLKQQVRDRKLWACHLGPELGGEGYGQVKLVADERDPRPLPVGPDHLRDPGARHRQRRDHRPLRHRRAEGALPAPAARRRDLLVATR